MKTTRINTSPPQSLATTTAKHMAPIGTTIIATATNTTRLG